MDAEARLPDVQVREARGADATELVALLDQLGFPASAEAIAARLDVMLRAGERVLVATQVERVVGLVTVHVTPVLHRPTSVGRMTALVVAEHVRGRGVGRRLVQAAEQRLRAAGCALVEVTSNHKWTEAHAFYRHIGYETTSVRFKKSLEPDGN